MEERKSYYVIIPAKVRYDVNLVPSAKLLYGEIMALANERGYCWATNDYFAKLYGVSTKSISTWVKNLCDAGYIRTEMYYQKGGKGGAVRLLKVTENFIGWMGQNVSNPQKENFLSLGSKLLEPQEENFQYNNTFNNSSCGIYQKRHEGNARQRNKKTFNQSSEPYLLAKLLEQEIAKNNPKVPESEKQKQSWAKDIDLMIRRDNQSPDDIAEVIIWCQQDSFWKSNILSGKKLREKFLQLSIKMTDHKS